MIKPFEFSEGERSYTCAVEAPRGAPDDTWWWFSVTGDMQRYAPFRTAKGDTRASVQTRVLAYYENRLFQISLPPTRGSHWGRRPAVVKPAAPTEAAPAGESDNTTDRQA